jgi:hypothetical protein
MVEPHAHDDGTLNQITRFGATPNCSRWWKISWAEVAISHAALGVMRMVSSGVHGGGKAGHWSVGDVLMRAGGISGH